MKIIKATYGNVDCTKEIQSKIINNKLVIRSNNSIIGDPMSGVVKFLVIEGEIDGESFVEKVQEGILITLPKSKKNRLGIFYSNNNHPEIYSAIDRSLETIKIASENKADILTCVWHDIPNNPFHQIQSWYMSQSHLNQLLQIMQCLYAAQEMGEYEYVSFLEHDVIYPEGYFDYPEFEDNQVLTNMNYGGVNINGWQNRNQNDEPFHQMTMKFKDAIKHCEQILPNALRTNNGMIETQTMKRIQWNAVNQPIHINHGVHFTSHSNIYDKINVYQNHPYWGNHSDYLYLFKK